METGHFYYIDDSYFVDFPDSYLMKNKETVNGQAHDRPCFYTFKDNSTGLYWMIPFLSQVSKFKKIYNSKKSVALPGQRCTLSWNMQTITVQEA